MTHADALSDHHRRVAAVSGAECHRDLLYLGPDPRCPSWMLYSCSACRCILSIDTQGVIRERRPLQDPRD